MLAKEIVGCFAEDFPDETLLLKDLDPGWYEKDVIDDGGDMDVRFAKWIWFGYVRGFRTGNNKNL